MTYAPKTWLDGSSGGTPITAADLNRIEQGVASASAGTPGPANSLAVGSVAAGPSASATITGTAPSQTLNLVLPQGPTGNGLQLKGQVATYSALPASAADGDTWLVASTGLTYTRTGGAWPPQANGAALQGPAGTTDFNGLTNVPTAFPPTNVITPATQTALNAKANTTSGAYKLLGTDGSGAQTTYPIDGSAPTPGTVPLRDGSGNIPGLHFQTLLSTRMLNLHPVGFYPGADLNGAVQVNNNNSMLPNIAYCNDATKVRWSGGTPTLVTAGSPASGAYNLITGCTSQPRANYRVETITDGQNVNVHFANGISANNDVTVFVDGLRLGLGTNTAGLPPDRGVWAAASSYGQITIQFTQALPRRIEVSCSRDMAFIGFSGSGRFAATNGAGRFRCAIVGDSYVSGLATAADGTNYAKGLASVFGALTGWDVFQLAAAGSGYVTQSSSDATSPYASSQRVSALNAVGALDLIVFFGTANDTGQTQAALNTATNTAWTAARTAYPNATIVVVGVESGVNSSYNTVAGYLSAAANAAVSAGTVDAFLDPRADGLFTGSGKNGAPAGDGTQDVLLSSDGLHPTQAGHATYAAWLIRRLGAVRTH